MSNPFYLRELLETANSLNVGIAVLKEEDSQALRQSLLRRYCEPGSQFVSRMNFTSYCRVHDEAAWSSIAGLMPSSPCYLFTDERDDPNVVELNNGTAASVLLGEMGGYTFYLCDQNLTFLICLSQYDEIWGAGTAKLWIQANYPSSGVRCE